MCALASGRYAGSVDLHDPQHTLAIDWRLSVGLSLPVYEAPDTPIPVGWGSSGRIFRAKAPNAGSLKVTREDCMPSSDYGLREFRLAAVVAVICLIAAIVMFAE
jgi:hypothetical protein